MFTLRLAVVALAATLAFSAIHDVAWCATAKSAEEASQDAKPGSHEDWCDEHAVPESQCTRCNAALIPAFKATNDWCADHGLPKSQCLVCNPNLKIQRPPKSGAE